MWCFLCVTKVFKAVAHVHERSCVFVDLKPANIMHAVRSGTMVVKLVDVGSARMTGSRLDDPLQPSWTPMYGSPEAAAAFASGTLGNVIASTASDVYSLGLIAAQFLDDTFTPVFASDTDAMMRLLQDPPALPLERLLCGRSARAQDLLRRMLHPVPERRPTMAQIMTEESLINPGMVSTNIALGAKIDGVGAKVTRAVRAADGAKDVAEAAIDVALAGPGTGIIMRGGGGGGGGDGMPEAVTTTTGTLTTVAAAPKATSHVSESDNHSDDAAVVRALEQLALRLEASNAALATRFEASNAALAERLEASNAAMVAAFTRCALAAGRGWWDPVGGTTYGSNITD
jgi:hypothetical protein